MFVRARESLGDEAARCERRSKCLFPIIRADSQLLCLNARTDNFASYASECNERRLNKVSQQTF